MTRAPDCSRDSAGTMPDDTEVGLGGRPEMNADANGSGVDDRDLDVLGAGTDGIAGCTGAHDAADR